MNKKTTGSKKVHRHGEYVTLSILNRFLHWMVIGIVSPVIVLLMTSKGAAISEIGIVMGILSFCVVSFELPSGIISDRIGRKKIYLLSLFIFAISFVLLLFSNNFVGLCISFSFFGTARAFASGSIESDFIDEYLEKEGPSRLDHLLTGMGVASTLGLATGSLVGGVLPIFTKIVFPELNQYSGNILAQLVLVVAIFIVALLTHTGRRNKEQHSIGDFLRKSLKAASDSRVVFVLLVAALVWGFSFAALEVYWQPLLKDILEGQEETGVFGAINSGYFLVGAVGTLLGSLVLRLFGSRHILVAGITRVLLGFGLVLLALQNQVWAFTIVYLLIMGANGILSIPEQILFNLNVADSRRATMLSLSSLVLQLGGIVSSILFSFIVARVGIPTVIVVAGVTLALSSLLYLFISQSKKPDKFVQRITG